MRQEDFLAEFLGMSSIQKFTDSDLIIIGQESCDLNFVQ